MARSTARALVGVAPVFAALGDEQRLRLVARLCEEGPLSITKLTEVTDISRQAVTKHLHVLESAGLVRSRREGRENVYRLELRRMEVACRHLEAISARWDDALDRLQALVEDEA